MLNLIWQIYLGGVVLETLLFMRAGIGNVHIAVLNIIFWPLFVVVACIR